MVYLPSLSITTSILYSDSPSRAIGTHVPCDGGIHALICITPFLTLVLGISDILASKGVLSGGNELLYCYLRHMILKLRLVGLGAIDRYWPVLSIGEQI